MMSLNMITGWLGGRSIIEMRNYSPVDYENSSLIGVFLLISVAVIETGQNLFWSHLPSTKESAQILSLLLTIIYVLFYRYLIRAQEIMNTLEKSIVFIVAVVIMAVNALLAGHEVVLIPFEPQVNLQMLEDGIDSIADQGKKLELLYGLPNLSKKKETIEGNLSAAKTEREKIPEVVSILKNDAQSCELIADGLKQRMNNLKDTEFYFQAKTDFYNKQRQCANLKLKTEQELQKHRQFYDQRIEVLLRDSLNAETEIHTATTTYDNQLKHDTPILKESASVGFARHQALWRAVETRKIPEWEAIGLMLICLSLEGMAFFLKYLLPASDMVTLERKRVALQVAEEVQQVTDVAKLRLAIMKQNKLNVVKILHDMETDLINDLKGSIKQSVMPEMKLNLKANIFESACARVKKTQSRTEKSSSELIADLVAMRDSFNNLL